MGGVHLPLLLLTILPTLPNSVFCMHLPAPANLSMDSQHFVHLLSWEAGPESPEGVSYTVDVCVPSKEGSSCETAPCSPVPDHAPLFCNLTEVFRYTNQTYYTRVSAVSGNRTSPPAHLPPFQPFKDTIPEAPVLRVLRCNGSLCVQLQAPSERLLSIYSCTVYPCFKYRLNISANREFKFWKEVQGLQMVVLEHLVPGQEYCVSVGIKDRSSPYSPAVCESTAAPESSAGALIFLVLGVIVLLSLGGSVVLFRCSFHVKTHLPRVLSSFEGPYKEQLMDCPSVLSLPRVSLEPGTAKGIERDEGGDEDEDPEGEGVAYERLGNQSGTCSGTSEPGNSSTPPPSVPRGSGYDRTHDPASEIPLSPVPQPVSRTLPPTAPTALTAPTEHRLKAQLSTGSGLQQKAVKLSAGGRSSAAAGLTGLSFIAHRYRDQELQDAEAEKEEEEQEVFNVNLSSLRLGGQVEEDRWEKEEIPEQVIPSSPHSVQDNTTHIPHTLPTHSPRSERNITDPEDEEEEEEEDNDEDEEEEDDYEDSGYMMHN